MTTAKHVALTLTVTLIALLGTAQAQTARLSTVNVTSDGERVHIAAQGDISEMRVDVADEQGEVVFQSGAITGQQLDWNMQDGQGERVAPGTYLVTVTFRNAAGKVRKRVEQVTVDEAEKADTKAVPTTTPNAVQADITGSGTANRIAKFTGAATIGNSIISENAGKINVGLDGAPLSTLTVKAATENYGLLHTNGTVQVGTWAGVGSAGTQGGWYGTKTNHPLRFFAYNSGAAMTIATDGNIGIGTPTPTSRLEIAAQDGLKIKGYQPFLTLQDDHAGSKQGFVQSVNGDTILLTNSRAALVVKDVSGNVGIGTSSPLSRLTVQTASENYGLLHTNGTVQVGTWAGSGSAGTQGGWYGTKTNHPLRFFAYNSGAAMTILPNGRVGIGTTNPTIGKLHVDGGTSTGVYGISSGTGIYAAGVYGESSGGINSTGVKGTSTSGSGVFGSSDSNYGVYGYSKSGSAVSGYSPSGYAGYFYGKVFISGKLTVDDCDGCRIAPSDRNLKANFTSVNPRLVLDCLSAIPIKAWNYKSEDSSIRHIGPMAQDFRAAFNLGKDDKHIDLLDTNGVTMASIQALYQMMQEKDKEIKQLRAQMTQQQAQLNQVKRTIKRKRTARR